MPSRRSSPALDVLFARAEATLDALGALLAVPGGSAPPQATEALLRRLRAEIKRFGASMDTENRRRSRASESASARSQSQQESIAKLRKQVRQERARADKAEAASARLQEQLAEMRAIESRGRRTIQDLHRYVRRLETRTAEGRPALAAPPSAAMSQAVALGAGLGDQADAARGVGLPFRPDGEAPAEPPHWSAVAAAAWSDIRPASMTPSIGRLNYATPAADLPRIAILVFGLDRAATEAMVTLVSEELMRSPAFTPVFLTDCSDFQPFRADHYAFEYFPRGAEMRPDADDLDWPAYHQRRASLLRDKWRPSHALVLGARPPFDPDLLRVPPASPASPDPRHRRAELARGT